MRGIRDQLAKQVATMLLRPDGKASTEEEVRPSDAQRIDVWFVPEADRARSCPGLLRRMTEQASMLEPFYKTPAVDEVRSSIRKQLSWRHLLSQEQAPPRAAPLLWIVSSGRPNRVIEGFGFSPREGWPSGVYALAPEWSVFLVVVLELPRNRDTLMLRLMGARSVFAKAVEDLMALPATAPERALEPRLRDLFFELEVKMKNTPLTEEEEDFVAGTKELFAKFVEETREQGRREGREQAAASLRRDLIDVYSSRFGTCPARISQSLESADFARLSQWVLVFATRSDEEIARTLRAQSA